MERGQPLDEGFATTGRSGVGGHLDGLVGRVCRSGVGGPPDSLAGFDPAIPRTLVVTSMAGLGVEAGRSGEVDAPPRRFIANTQRRSPDERLFPSRYGGGSSRAGPALLLLFAQDISQIES